MKSSYYKEFVLHLLMKKLRAIISENTAFEHKKAAVLNFHRLLNPNFRLPKMFFEIHNLVVNDC